MGENTPNNSENQMKKIIIKTKVIGIKKIKK